MFVLLFSFVLEGDDNKTDEDVDHEKGDNDDINDEIDRNIRPVIEERPVVWRVGINGFVRQSATNAIRSRNDQTSQDQLHRTHYILSSYYDRQFLTAAIPLMTFVCLSE